MHRKPRKSDENRVPHVIGYDPRDHHGPGLSEDHPQRRHPLPMGVNGRTVEFTIPRDNLHPPTPRSTPRFLLTLLATLAVLGLAAWLLAASGR